MPKKYQSGKLETRDDVKRPYYFVRATVYKMDPKTNKRKAFRVAHKLGFVKKLGLKDEITEKRADELRAAFLQKLNAGRFVIPADLKFKELSERYVALRLPEMGVATRAQYESQIRNHIAPYFSDMKLKEIDRMKVEEFLAAKSETLGWWARNNLRSIIGAMFKAAKDWKLWEGENPTVGIRLGRKKFVREKRLLKVEDLRRLLAALPDHLKFLVLLMFGLGLRISEALGLKWSDFDFESGTVKIERRWYRGDLDETKTETSAAAIGLSKSLLYEVQSRYPGMHKRASFLFISEDGELPPDERDMLRFEFRPILKRLGLYYPGFGWHAFRRQHVTWRQQLGGATPLEAQKGARHASLDMTYLYTLPDHEREVQQQQRMFDELLGKVEGPPQ